MSPAGYWYNAGTSGSPNWTPIGGGWSLTGNAGTTPGTINFIGTTDNKDWVVKTNNMDRIRVLAGGNVGIGTSSPGNKLEVITNTTYISAVRGVNNSTGAGVRTGGSFVANGGGASSANIGLSASASGAVTNINLSLENLGAAANNYSLYSSALAKSYFNGSVGIGTGSPANKLDVAGSIAVGSGYVGTAAPTNGAIIEGTLGIGTPTPAAKLEVWGDARVVSNSANIVFTSIGSGTWRVYGSTGTTKMFRIEDSDAGANRLMIDQNGRVGIGMAPSASYQLTLNGSGLAFGGAWVSDQQFKTEIDSISNALNIINQLKPKTYYFDTTNIYGLNFSSKKQYGFLAQELEQVLPELVTTSTKDEDVDTLGNVIHPAVTFKAISYLELIAFLTKGIQEQQQIIDSVQTKANNQDSINITLQSFINQLQVKENNQDSIITFQQNKIDVIQNQLIADRTLFQDQLNQLSQAITQCCNAPTTRSMQTPTDNSESQPIKQTIIDLSNKNVVVLDQNSPNPFREQTTINYYLPENTNFAQIIFTEQSGRIIKTLDLKEKGKGSITIFANDLSGGTYIYSLSIDGNIIETKTMVKQ